MAVATAKGGKGAREFQVVVAILGFSGIRMPDENVMEGLAIHNRAVSATIFSEVVRQVDIYGRLLLQEALLLGESCCLG